ncbi:MAG: LytTR family DNA-binding domain-containing protein [Bacteroidales bacterium]|nr:LytTR family DNA-binding domain-containing protein [Bacteroidales bacterium]
MKALIIEDEIHAARRIQSYLTELRPNFKIVDILDSIEDSVQWFNSNEHPDVIFLDIQLSDGLSFEIFKQVSTESLIVFTTAFDEYAVKAFELNCIDYLLKPIAKEKLEYALAKLEKYSQRMHPFNSNSQLLQLMNIFQNNTPSYRNRFLISKPDEYIPLLINDVAYFYTQNEKVFLVTHQGCDYSIKYSLETLENELDPELFWRANRSYIVSLKSIKSAQNYFNYKIKLILDPPSQHDVIVSKKKVNDFKNWFN